MSRPRVRIARRALYARVELLVEGRVVLTTTKARDVTASCPCVVETIRRYQHRPKNGD